MELQTTVLVTAENDSLLPSMQSLFSKEEVIFISVPCDGVAVLRAIPERNADIVLMHSEMAHIDAVGVMRAFLPAEDQKQPIYFVLESQETKMTAKDLYDAGASYCFGKPIDLDLLRNKIQQIRRRQELMLRNEQETRKHQPTEEELELRVTDILHQIGIPAHIKGYHYVRMAIILSVQNSEMIEAVTKLLYPTVAKAYETTSSRVERAIRHAIEVAWDRGDVDVLTSYFGYTINSGRGKPTNSEFVAMIADKLRLEQRLAG